MSRGSFGRTVARAAASGGSKSYRARPPVLWYLAMLVIVVGGLGLVVYSRYEKLHPAAAATTASGPTKTDNWYSALAVDLCGKVQPNIAANTNLTTAGIRTFGDGVVNIDPAAVKVPTDFTGAKATLGTFVTTYGHGFKLTATSLRLPGSTKTWTNGESCPSSSATPGKGQVRVMVWSSTTATGSIYQGNPADLKLTNGQMITVGFVPSTAKLPEPPARTTLEQDLSKGSG